MDLIKEIHQLILIIIIIIINAFYNYSCKILQHRSSGCFESLLGYHSELWLISRCSGGLFSGGGGLMVNFKSQGLIELSCVC